MRAHLVCVMLARSLIFAGLAFENVARSVEQLCNVPANAVQRLEVKENALEQT